MYVSGVTGSTHVKTEKRRGEGREKGKGQERQERERDGERQGEREGEGVTESRAHTRSMSAHSFTAQHCTSALLQKFSFWSGVTATVAVACATVRSHVRGHSGRPCSRIGVSFRKELESTVSPCVLETSSLTSLSNSQNLERADSRKESRTVRVFARLSPDCC